MVVTSAVCWLFIAIFFVILYNIHYSSSVRMTYGLVYRNNPQHTATGPSTAQSVVQSSAVLPLAEPSKVVANETKISVQTQSPNSPASTTVLIKPKYRYLQNDTKSHRHKYGVRDRQPALASANTRPRATVVPVNKYQQSLAPTVPVASDQKSTSQPTEVVVTANAINQLQEEVAPSVANHQHQYQVREDDSEAEGTSLAAVAEKKGAEHSHKNEAKHGKKYEKGSSGHRMKEKKDHKKGEFDEAKHHGGKHGGMKGGYQSQSKHEGGSEKADHKLKKGSYGKKGVKKKYSKKKGYKDKYKKDEEHKVHEFWHDHQETGEFFEYGKKKKHKHDSKNLGKKGKHKKSSKKSKKKKKHGEHKKKEGGKSDSGHNTRKDSKHFYHNEQEYSKNSKKSNNAHKGKKQTK